MSATSHSTAALPAPKHRKLWTASGQGNLGVIQNQETTWEDYVARLRKQYVVLPVTTAGYAGMSSSDKHALKKELPFSLGAMYRGSERKAANVALRDTLNIDCDKLDPCVYDAVLSAARALNVAFLHVGSSSNGVNGRRSGRLIFPLSRSVEPRKEFAAVSRKTAEHLGINSIDPVSHRANQICYVPSRCSDALEVFEATDGPWLDVESCLAEYVNWTEPGQWPRACGELAVFSEVSQLGDPREKPAWIGAFCRKYDFLEAILTFDLPYDSTDDEARWTPRGGTSSFGGARLYGVASDPSAYLWMYNEHQHGLSPKINVNAYDAVRLHKFGDLDDPRRPDGKDRSERAMREWINADHPDVVEDARALEFADEFVDLDATDTSWMDEPDAPTGNEGAAVQTIVIPYIHGCAQLKATELLGALIRHGPRLGLYVMAGRIVEAKCGSNGASVDFIALNHDAFAARLRGHIEFSKKSKDGSRITACPPELCRAVFGLTHDLDPIAIRSVAHTPIWRDGRLQAKPGLNQDTHTWIDAPQVLLPTISDKTAAIRARDYLLTWIDEFPFVSTQDRAVALAAIVSAAMRASVRSPGFSISKPSLGAGASYLTDLIHVVLTGTTAPVINGGGSGEEIDKEVNAAQLAGRASLVFDNIPPGSAFNSTAVAQSITQDLRAIRRLGKSESLTVNCSQLVLFNGINLRVADDLVRRCLPIELDPMLENPEARTFRRKTLIEDARRDRIEILTAAFTIVATYAESGEHEPVQTIAGFDPWCRVVAAALKWVGEPDLATSQRKLKLEDPASNQLRILATASRVLFGRQPFTAAQIVAASSSRIYDETGTDEEIARHSEARTALEELIDEVSPGKRGSGIPNSVGLFLRKNKKRVIDGFQLEATVGHNNTSRWYFRELRPKVEMRDAASGESPLTSLKVTRGDALIDGPDGWVASLDIDEDVVRALTSAGYSSIREIADGPVSRLAAISDFDEETVGQLCARAKFIVEHRAQ